MVVYGMYDPLIDPNNTESGCNMDVKSHAFDLGKVSWFKIALILRCTSEYQNAMEIALDAMSFVKGFR